MSDIVNFLIHNGLIYGVFHAIDIPSNKPTPFTFDPDNVSLPEAETFRRREYRIDRDFYLAFASRCPCYSNSALLQCLEYNKRFFPVEGLHRTYHLSSAVQEKWHSLESLLTFAISSLQRVVYPAQPLYMTIFWPCQYGYQKNFFTSRRA